MKNLIIAIVFSCSFIACTESKKTESKTVTVGDTAKVLPSKKAEGKMLNQHKLIEELTKLQSALENKNPEELGNYFPFPVRDTALIISEVNPDFDQQRSANNNQLTKEMLINHFSRLYDYWDLTKFSNLFKHLNLKELEDKDNISNTHHIKDDGCYYIYSIKVINKEVIISYGTNSDDAYRQQHPDEEEVCEEYQWTWIFLWDGHHLQVKKQLIAG
ncbi:hypothetical protein OQZ33_20880 [Pedobacter sp. MC2016-05]|uniref:hypothetical protein n=1 Tax=Pedobacter sp. MC2016-05 TaxID=2994474 RepID=UPI002246DB4F|nr:hypothetical protein [Pedobacter sp. MC2016-05]MCX2476800.1 hypothetical protein [Pedobacter sp. MC2016-05]